MLRPPGYFAGTVAPSKGAAMLSERDRQVLSQIEAALMSRDRRFVEAMRNGRPRAPREYRRWVGLLLLALWIAVVAATVVTGSPFAILALILVSIGGLMWFVFRRLDRA